ncbi:uncharacterized protein LOC143459323 [Clavelina lepadiformis]|uniref:uncharacterized protein LOC143459323 n=1 Tax=Clavelina lepadiformis TaxID=159417 RepID=UPI0040432981
MPCCAAMYCSNNQKNSKLYRFPRDELRRRQWAINCGRPKWRPTENSKLCEVHFEESDFKFLNYSGRKVLKKTAMPRIFKNFGKSRKGKHLKNATINNNRSSDGIRHNTETEDEDLACITNGKDGPSLSQQSYIHSSCPIELLEDLRENSSQDVKKLTSFSGNRIISCKCFSDILNEVCTNHNTYSPECQSKLRVVREEDRGLGSGLTLICDKCPYTSQSYRTYDSLVQLSSNPEVHMSKTNVQLATGIVQAGISVQAAKILLNALKIPSPSLNTLETYCKEVSDYVKPLITPGFAYDVLPTLDATPTKHNASCASNRPKKDEIVKRVLSSVPDKLTVVVVARPSRTQKYKPKNKNYLTTDVLSNVNQRGIVDVCENEEGISSTESAGIFD